jgi:O-antigen/teichoic acid export membrane protein
MKKLIKHGLIYGVTSSLQNILTFALLPILTTYYNPAEFGVYSIILLSGTLANAIFYLGASSALGRYYFEVDNDNYRKQIISSTFYISFFGAIMLCLTSFIFREEISITLFSTKKYGYHLFYTFIGTAFGFLLNILTLIIRYQNKSKFYFLVSIGGLITNFTITYFLLVKLELGILAPILGTMISNGSFFFLLFLRILNFINIKIQLSLIKNLLTFGLMSSITSICYFLLDWVDRLIIKELLTMSDVGIYSLSYKLGAIINILLVMPFGLIWAPLRLQYLKNHENYDTFVTKVISYFCLVGTFIITTTILFGENFIHIFFVNKQFSGVVTIFPVVMFALLVYGLQGILDFGIYYYKKMHYYILISFFGIIINIGLNFYLIPKFGIVSAAFTTLITYICTTTFIFIASNKFYKIKLEWNRILILFLVISVLYFIANYSETFLILGVFGKSIIIFIFILIIYRFWLSNQERKYIKLVFKQYILRF